MPRPKEDCGEVSKLAQADSHSAAYTRSRNSLIAVQVNRVVSKTTEAPDFSALTKKGIVENTWISEVKVEAYDNEDNVWAQVVLRIDWHRHKINLTRHGKNVTVDRSLPEEDQANWDINEIIKWVNDYREENGLHTRWVIGYTKEVIADKAELARVRRALGTTNRHPFKMMHELESLHFEKSLFLDELSMEIQMAKPPNQEAEEESASDD